jgi:hypothetical protein
VNPNALTREREVHLIAAAARDGAAYDTAIDAGVRPEDFADDLTRACWRAVGGLRDEGASSIRPTDLKVRLRIDGAPEGAHALVQAIREAERSTAEQVEADAWFVRQAAEVRVLRERFAAAAAAYLAREDVLGDDSYAKESADELLEHGILTFEGDPPIAIKGRWSPPVDEDAVGQTQQAVDAAAAAAGPVEWPPGYNGQVIGTIGEEGVKFAFSVNDDLNPFTHPEQIGRLPPADRLHDTPEACVAAAWAHYRANGGST